MAESDERFGAMRATVTQSTGVSEGTITEFLRSQPELRGRDPRVSLENADVKAGVSAGHLFFRLDDAGNYDGRYVVRFAIGTNPLFRQTSLRHQFEVMQALRSRGLPVPDAVWFDEAALITGETPALIMRRVEDGIPPHMLYMEKGPFAEASPEKRRKLLNSYMQFCAQLHAQPVLNLGLDFLSSRGGAGSHFIDREINWMETELHSRFPEQEEPGERAALLTRLRRTCDEAAQWLRERAPRHRKPVLVHGDVTLGNVMFKEDGTVAAVLDWELCHEGLPAEDVTWLVLAAHCAANFYEASTVALPTMAETREAYASAGGSLEDFQFAAVLSVYRLLSIAALAMRSMPQEFWPSQEELWDRLVPMLDEWRGDFEKAGGAHAA